MKRIHIHVAVDSLEENLSFYSALFGTEATVIKPDYAKWLLDDPKINFAISTGHQNSGIRHLGIQVDSLQELADVEDRVQEATQYLDRENSCSCCYSLSEKSWITDPQDISWETFYTHGVDTVYGRGKYDRSSSTGSEGQLSGKDPELVNSACETGCSIS